MKRALWMTALLAGCYSPNFGDGQLHCATTEPRCPSGYECADDISCWKSGTLLDLSGVVTDHDGGDGGGHADGAGGGDMPDLSVPIDLGPPDLRPAVTVSLTQSSIDVLAFGAPPQQLSVTATVGNLDPGDDTTVDATVASGDSANIVSVASNVITVSPAPKYDFGASTTAPPPTLVTVRSHAHPEAASTLTVNVHAWVDESAAVDAVFNASDQVLLATVDLQPNGAAMVGGIGYTTHVPVAAARSSSGNWTSAYSSGSTGIISGVAAAADGSFVAGGLLGPDQGSGNRQVFVSHCTGSPVTCSDTNLAPVGEKGNGWLFSSVSQFNSPRIVTSGTSKFVTYATFDNICSVGGYGVLKVLYSNTANLDDAFDSSHVIAFGSENPASANGNSCPFSTYAAGGLPTGMALNSAGTQLWLGGSVPCGTTTSGNGCTSQTSASGVYGLASVTVTDPGLVWRSHWSEGIAAGTSNINVRRGYDDSLIGIGTAPALTANLVWYSASPSPSPTPHQISAPNNGNFDNGIAAGGAGVASSSWAPSGTDLFFIADRSAGSGITEYYVTWYASSTHHKKTIWVGGVGGTVLYEFAMIKNAAGKVEGYAVGNHTTTSLTTFAPSLFHLK